MLHDDAGTPNTKPRHALIQKLADPSNLKNFMLLHDVGPNEVTLIYPSNKEPVIIRIKVTPRAEFEEMANRNISLSKSMGDGVKCLYETEPDAMERDIALDYIVEISDTFFNNRFIDCASWNIKNTNIIDFPKGHVVIDPNGDDIIEISGSVLFLGP